MNDVHVIRRALARDPNTDPEILAQLAQQYIEDVLANPALPLLLLESPALRLVITGARSMRGQEALNDAIRGASEPVLFAFRLLCLWRAVEVLPDRDRLRAQLQITYESGNRHAVPRLSSYGDAGERVMAAVRAVANFITSDAQGSCACAASARAALSDDLSLDLDELTWQVAALEVAQEEHLTGPRTTRA